MKKRLFLALAVSTLLAPSAFADSVFMLQFGSFESQNEAQSHLGELKSKHADLIGNLPTSIRTISLPPDNLTVYRTQAGPVVSRAAAQQVCSSFAASGDECYVVESAMVAQGTPVGTQQMSAPSASASAMPAALPATTAIAQAAPVYPPAPVGAPTSLPPTASTQPMEDELAAAAANQQAQQQAIANAPPAQPSVAHSVWWHMNPFSKAPAAAPAAVAAVPVTAPVEEVTTTTVTTPPPPPNPAMGNGSTPPPVRSTVTTTTVTSAPAVPMAAAPAPMMAPPTPQEMAANDIPPSMMHLPPPPPPLRGQTPPPPPPAAMPQPVGAIPAPMPVAMQPAPGSVRVGEAQRVPLSQQNAPAMPAMVASVPSPTALPMTQPAVSLHPSSTLGQKTLWAQVGMFADAQSALAYWESYRQTHPDFPVVRVRVASSYMSQQRGDSHVALRVGPFARPEFVHNLCSTIANGQLHCALSTDLGIAVNPFAPNPGILSDSRYHR